MQHFLTFGVNQVALIGHHVVIFEDVFTDLEVLRLRLVLRGLDAPGNHLGFQRQILGVKRRIHKPGYERRHVLHHQRVIHSQVETRFPGVTLTSRTPAQLVINTASIVTFGAEDVESAQVNDLFVFVSNLGLGLGKGVLPSCLPFGEVLLRIQAARA